MSKQPEHVSVASAQRATANAPKHRLKWPGLLLLMLALTFVAACGNNQGAASPSASAPASESPSSDAATPAPSTSDTPYPEKNIEIIVPFNAGGVSDILARAFAEAATGVIDKSITIKNVGGGSGTIGNYELVKAKPDGYTWLWAATGHISSSLHITPAQYTRDDFTIVNKAGEMAAVIVVPKDSPFQTLQDLIDHAKANPGQVTVGNPGEGTVVALLANLLEDRADIKLQHVPFQGSGPLLPAVLGKHVDAGFMNVPEIQSQVAAGELRALATLSEKRVDKLPDVPTALEQGVDVAGGASHFIVIPNNVPAEVVAKIDEITKAVYETDRFKELMDQVGYQISYKNAADSLAEVDAWHKTTEDLYRKLGRIK